MRAPKVIRDLLCEDDAGSVWCLVRVSAAGGVVTFLGSSVFNLVHHASLDLQAFGIGFSALVAGVGGAMQSKVGQT